VCKESAVAQTLHNLRCVREQTTAIDSATVQVNTGNGTNERGWGSRGRKFKSCQPDVIAKGLPEGAALLQLMEDVTRGAVGRFRRIAHLIESHQRAAAQCDGRADGDPAPA
jgi:hypothetical protein